MKGLLQKKDLGKILFNLVIETKCYKTTFENHPLDSAEDQIERMGCAIRVAKKLLKGIGRLPSRAT